MTLFDLWFSQGICPVVGLLGHVLVLYLVFWGTAILFSIVAGPVYIPTNSAQVLLFFTFSPTLVICCLFDNSHSNRCEMISHCGFDLHFPDDWRCWTPFHVSVVYLYVFFGRMSIQILYPFFQSNCFLILSCISSLHILDIKTLSDIWFTNIFSHSVGCLFILLMVSFAVQKLFSLMSLHCLFLLLFPFL